MQGGIVLDEREVGLRRETDNDPGAAAPVSGLVGMDTGGGGNFRPDTF